MVMLSRGSFESVQDSAFRRRSSIRTTRAQRTQLTLERLEFLDTVDEVADVVVEQVIDPAAVFFGRVPAQAQDHFSPRSQLQCNY